jgi:dTDP-4-amino-4,6-dideoxygalactose transaminase
VTTSYLAPVSAHAKRPAILGGHPAFSGPVYFTRPPVPDPGRLGALTTQVFESRWFTNDGVLVRELEDRLGARLGVPWCAMVCNGTTALQVALRALDLTGEVITTPFTFPATVHAIAWSGLTPVFCDIDPRTYALDPGAVTALVSERTSALLPVHVFGNPCDVPSLETIAGRHGLRVIYDAAQAFGARSGGLGIGRCGDLSVFSFHATKVFHTAEGGAVVGHDPALLERVASLRNFAIRDEEETSGIGINGKMSELHAAVGLALLDTIDDEMGARRRLRAHYVARLAGVEGLVLQEAPADGEANHAYFTVEIDPRDFGLTRDEVQRALSFENIVARRYFWPLCSENPYYRRLPSAAPERLPNAHRVASRILCLPLYGDLGFDDVDRIVDALLALRDASSGVRRRLETAPRAPGATG